MQQKITVLLNNTCRRTIQTSLVNYKEVIRSLKGRKTSSQEWLKRQLSDPYIEKARMANYRCRSAFKLLEIDDKYKILNPGNVVVDCGASPGSWSQVAVSRTNADRKDSKKKYGKVIGIDLKPIHPIDGATVLSNLDFTSQDAKDRILELLNNKDGNKCQEIVDVVLSDMAPNATGVKAMDHDNIINLAYHVVRFALPLTVVNGSLLVKIWNGINNVKLQNDISKFYTNVKVIKPDSSRGDSSELFILATGFKGIKR